MEDCAYKNPIVAYLATMVLTIIIGMAACNVVDGKLPIDKKFQRNLLSEHQPTTSEEMFFDKPLWIEKRSDRPLMSGLKDKSSPIKKSYVLARRHGDDDDDDDDIDDEDDEGYDGRHRRYHGFEDEDDEDDHDYRNPRKYHHPYDDDDRRHAYYPQKNLMINLLRQFLNTREQTAFFGNYQNRPILPLSPSLLSSAPSPFFRHVKSALGLSGDDRLAGANRFVGGAHPFTFSAPITREDYMQRALENIQNRKQKLLLESFNTKDILHQKDMSDEMQRKLNELRTSPISSSSQGYVQLAPNMLYPSGNAIQNEAIQNRIGHKNMLEGFPGSDGSLLGFPSGYNTDNLNSDWYSNSIPVAASPLSTPYQNLATSNYENNAGKLAPNSPFSTPYQNLATSNYENNAGKLAPNLPFSTPYQNLATSNYENNAGKLAPNSPFSTPYQNFAGSNYENNVGQLPPISPFSTPHQNLPITNYENRAETLAQLSADTAKALYGIFYNKDKSIYNQLNMQQAQNDVLTNSALPGQEDSFRRHKEIKKDNKTDVSHAKLEDILQQLSQHNDTEGKTIRNDSSNIFSLNSSFHGAIHQIDNIMNQLMHIDHKTTAETEGQNMYLNVTANAENLLKTLENIDNSPLHKANCKVNSSLVSGGDRSGEKLNGKMINLKKGKTGKKAKKAKWKPLQKHSTKLGKEKSHINRSHKSEKATIQNKYQFSRQFEQKLNKTISKFANASVKTTVEDPVGTTFSRLSKQSKAKAKKAYKLKKMIKKNYQAYQQLVNEFRQESRSVGKVDEHIELSTNSIDKDNKSVLSDNNTSAPRIDAISSEIPGKVTSNEKTWILKVDK